MQSSTVRKLLVVFVLCLMLCPTVAFAAEKPVVAQSLQPGDSSALKYDYFYGSGWITGKDATLGKVYIYVPISSKGTWGTSSTGYLCNVGGTSVSGVMYTENGTLYTFSASSFAYPRYRLSNSTSYQYYDLHLTVEDSNLNVATAYPPSLVPKDAYPLIYIGLLGVVILCLMRYRR